MNKSSYPLEIQAEIDGIVARWQVLHQRLIWTLVAIASAVELIYLVALNRIDGFLSIGLGLYFLKYAMAPILMSLALALGLSSMSSRNLAIGSLFIDEGFGNLDHESLDLVMNALGNLENAQGRKVGVISHTEQIRNQISPQIRLVKTSRGGCSRIEVG